MPATTPRTEHAGPTPLAVRLRSARLRSGLSLRAATDGIGGISPATLCRVERGERHLSGSVLLALGERLEISRDELADLAGGITGDGLEELMASHIVLALRGGHLLPDAMAALRGVHLGLLAQLTCKEYGATLDDLSYALKLDFRVTDENPGFEPDTTFYRVPHGANGGPSPMWQAHGLAHAVLAVKESAMRICTPEQMGSPREREVTILARHLLLPTAALRNAHRQLGAPEPREAGELAGLVEALAGTFSAPAGWIAARLAEEGLLGIAA